MTARWMVLLGIGSALAVGDAGTVRAAPAMPAASQCRVANTYRISSVKPYRVADYIVPTDDRAHLQGASLLVDAQPGLTKEWLQRAFEISIATGECGLGAEPVTVSVESAGAAFQVDLSTPDEKAAAELLRRSQLMAR